MSDSNRGDRNQAVNDGLGVFVAIALACLIVGWIAYVSGHQSSDKDHRSYEYSQAAKRNAQIACGNLPPAAVTDCIYDEISSARQQAQAEQDLDAQQWMALWAGVLVVVTLATTFISWVALRYLRDTFRETSKAAVAAIKATETMVDSNTIANKSLDALYRPRVHIRAFGPLIHDNEDRPFEEGQKSRHITLYARVEMENAGQEPVLLIDAGVWADVEDHSSKSNARNKFLRPGDTALLGWGADHLTPNETHHKVPVGYFLLTEDNRLTHSAVPAIHVRALYRNVLDEIYEHRLAFKPTGTWTDAEWQIHGGKEHNYRRKIR